MLDSFDYMKGKYNHKIITGFQFLDTDDIFLPAPRKEVYEIGPSLFDKEGWNTKWLHSN